MAHTYEELKHKTVAELREICTELGPDAVQGNTQMDKEHLLPLLCKALGIEAHAHHEVVGINKLEIKGKIQELKKKRAEALAAKDNAKLKKARDDIRKLKRTLRRAMV